MMMTSDDDADGDDDDDDDITCMTLATNVPHTYQRQTECFQSIPQSLISH